jgi:hypothetical protein
MKTPEAVRRRKFFKATTEAVDYIKAIGLYSDHRTNDFTRTEIRLKLVNRKVQPFVFSMEEYAGDVVKLMVDLGEYVGEGMNTIVNEQIVFMRHAYSRNANLPLGTENANICGDSYHIFLRLLCETKDLRFSIRKMLEAALRIDGALFSANL